MVTNQQLLALVLLLGVALSAAQCPWNSSPIFDWSSPSTWGGSVPESGADVVIQGNRTVLLDISPPPLNSITIRDGGRLVWGDVDGLEIVTNYIYVGQDGKFEIGSEQCKFTKKATITLTGLITDPVLLQGFGGKFIGVGAGGTLEFHGALPSPSWTQLAATVTSGNSIISLIRSVEWKAGDRIVLASTDFSYLQAEEFELVECPECAGNQVKLSEPVKYTHFGEIVDGVDERGEVALLTRNIVIRGKMEPNCYANGTQPCNFFNYDTYGAHLKVIRGFTAVHIEGVEFYHVGQQILGSYPVHFHMAGDVDEVGEYIPRTYVKDSSIHHSFSRCVTIHGTHGLLVQNNVAYDHLGHCFFLEDGIETRNVFDGNIGLVTRPSTILPSDRTYDMCTAITPFDFNGNPTSPGECNGIATFWIENPNNDLINNVAAGSHNTGFWYIFPYKPSGESEPFGANVFPTFTPLGRFEYNKAHSNNIDGLHFDDGIKITPPSASQPQQYLSMSTMRYKPRADPTNPNSARVPAVLKRFTAYKNRNRGVWVRGGDFRFIDYRSADNAIGMTFASDGDFPNDPGSSQELDGGIFVGETPNVGNDMTGGEVFFWEGRSYPKYEDFPIRGWEFYDGPTSINNATFTRFFDTSFRNASAIGWLLYNHWQNSPHNNATNLRFDNSRRVLLTVPNDNDFGNLDGDRNAIFKDKDGSVSGVRGATVVPGTPYFHTYRCIERVDWEAYVCHNKYGITLIRDERSHYAHNMLGIPNGDPRSQFQPIILLEKSYTLHFPHATPPDISFVLVNWDAGNSIRLGICFPRDVQTFNVRTVIGDVNTPLTRVNSIEELTNDTYYFDNEVGLLFVKLVAKYDRIGNNYCGARGCESLRIAAAGGSIGTYYNCSDAYPKYSVEEDIPNDPGCIGDLDDCGVCNGDGSSCATTGTTGVSSISVTTATPSSFAATSSATASTGITVTLSEATTGNPEAVVASGVVVSVSCWILLSVIAALTPWI